MKVLVIDNYDSFTYNLVYLLKEDNVEVDIFRNDKIDPESCLNYDGIIFSPGPGIPENAGNLNQILQHCAGQTPILGVCLGHQAIGEYLGGKLKNLQEVYHGVESDITLTSQDSPIFKNLPDSFKVGRYHSWIIDEVQGADFEVTARDKHNVIMALQQKDKGLFGIQFHPESVMTPEGKTILQNFIQFCKN